MQTQVANSQQGTAFVELSHDPGADFKMVVRYEMYCGDGTGADGLCVNIGGNDLGGRVGENGVTQGVAVCFDEWANSGDHGVAIYYNAGTQGDGDTSRAGAIWENIAPCGKIAILSEFVALSGKSVLLTRKVSNCQATGRTVSLSRCSTTRPGTW